MKYIMVTQFDNHWDKIPYNKTSYTYRMLKGGMSTDKIEENVPTIFIKRNKETGEPEKAWEGKVYDFERGSERVYFKVKIEKSIDAPSKHYDYKEGWYLGTEEPEEGKTEAANRYHPPFFDTLKTTSDWRVFENNIYYLLKLIGIHQIQHYKIEKQKGRADGFFKTKTLAVIYDATLEKDFAISKEEQLNNYCDQLKRGFIKYQGVDFTFPDCQKQVWVITRGNDRVIRKKDDVTIREVTVNKVISIYQDRLEQELNEDQTEERLRCI